MIAPFYCIRVSSETWKHYKIHLRYIHITSALWSKVGKRRKDDRLKLAPHLEAIVHQTQKKRSKDFCLEHFDRFYSKAFAGQWPSMRLALFSRPKFCALLNNYGDRDTAIRRLNKMGCYSIKKIYNEQISSIDYKRETNESSEKNCNSEHSEMLVDQPTPISIAPYGSSMTVELASKRIIQPKQVLSQGERGEIDASSASMLDFVPSTKIKGMDDFVEESEYYNMHDALRAESCQKRAIPIEIRNQEVLQFPKLLEAFTFAPGATDMRLEPPEKGLLGTFDYYCMDAASLLPVIALGVKEGDAVLDMCAAPGGKTLAILQTMLPRLVVSNDRDHRRMKRLLDMSSAYFQGYNTNLAMGLLEFRNLSGQSLSYKMANSFDRVLCDVPCTSDRSSLHQDYGNLFNASRTKLRLRMPQEQSSLLQSAMKCVKTGGSVVYSTCTLSPIQNDGVIYDALKQIWISDGIEFIVEDLSRSLWPLKFTMNISDRKASTQTYYGDRKSVV